jgi:hypothetical protein
MYGRLGNPKPTATHTAALGLALDPSAKHTIFRSKKVYRGEKEKLPTLEIHSVRVARRPDKDGRTKTDMVIEMTQRRRGYLDAEKQKRAEALPPDSPDFDAKFRPDFTYRGGCTLLIDSETGAVRYCISKNILSESRLARQREFAREHFESGLRATYDPEAAVCAVFEPFAMLHRSY